MQTGFKKNKKGDLLYYTIPAFEKTGMVRHCFSTRLGGVSKGECSSLNLGFNKKDLAKNVENNYKRLCLAIGVNPYRLVFSNQVHDDRIKVVTKEDCADKIGGAGNIKGIDALITNEPGIALATFYADCVPVYLLDTKNRAIGLVHSGWRSTVLNISGKTVTAMANSFESEPENILAAIGPSIGKCHFEVDLPVAEQFEGRYVTKADNDKYYVDLWEVIYDQLTSSGILDNNITMANLCTYCNNNIFFSHRADKGKTGSLAAIMELL